MPPGMAGLADDDISIVDEVKGNLPKMPTLTKAPRSALKGQNSNPMGMGLLQGFGAGSSMQVRLMGIEHNKNFRNTYFFDTKGNTYILFDKAV